jgi:hypothetical protein
LYFDFELFRFFLKNDQTKYPNTKYPNNKKPNTKIIFLICGIFVQIFLGHSVVFFISNELMAYIGVAGVEELLRRQLLEAADALPGGGRLFAEYTLQRAKGRPEASVVGDVLALGHLAIYLKKSAKN